MPENLETPSDPVRSPKDVLRDATFSRGGIPVGDDRRWTIRVCRTCRVVMTPSGCLCSDNGFPEDSYPETVEVVPASEVARLAEALREAKTTLERLGMDAKAREDREFARSSLARINEQTGENRPARDEETEERVAKIRDLIVGELVAGPPVSIPGAADWTCSREEAEWLALVIVTKLPAAVREAEDPIPFAGWPPQTLAEVKHNERVREAEGERLTAELLRDVANSGVSFDDPRVGYVEVQIDRETWDKLRSIAAREVEGG